MNVANIKRLYPYVLPYKRFAFLNVFFNILYALFSSLSFVALIPMLEVLFDARARIYQKPVYKGISEANIYFKEYLNYQVTQHAGGDPVQALSYIIALVLLLFFLKNIFNYLAIVFINLLRNGVLKDLRNMMYKKIISLPISYFSEKRKGDVISRITTDINEFQTSYLSILGTGTGRARFLPFPDRGNSFGAAYHQVFQCTRGVYQALYRLYSAF